MQTIFCVQTYRRQGRRLEAGQLRQFGEESEARASGKALSTRMQGVLVFEISGEPEADFWEDPRLLESYGDVPPPVA